MEDFGRMGHDYATITPKMTLKGPILILYDKFGREVRNKKDLHKGSVLKVGESDISEKWIPFGSHW